jgi:lipoprotein NlpD
VNVFARHTIATLTAVLLSACSTPPAPVEDRSEGPSAAQRITEDGMYRVSRGDSLYSIAFIYGLDWKDVANWNGVSRPFTIFPGQELRLTAPSGRQAGNTQITTRAAGTAPRASTRPAETPAPTTIAGSTSNPPVADSVPESPVATPPQPEVSSPPPTSQTVASSQRAIQSPAPGPLKDPESWLWPTEGRILSNFSAADPARKGIDIVGTEGQDIIASADGEVVYSGNGLIGFGELIIIKHSESMLTAYAHNRSRLVQEGERVSAGSTIAEMGKNHQDKTMLHFELRIDGKPVDPLRYLPQR